VSQCLEPSANQTEIKHDFSEIKLKSLRCFRDRASYSKAVRSSSYISNSIYFCCLLKRCYSFVIDMVSDIFALILKVPCLYFSRVLLEVLISIKRYICGFKNQKLSLSLRLLSSSLNNRAVSQSEERI